MKEFVAVRASAHKSDKLNAVSEGAEILYRRLLETVDDNGNFDADPAVMLGELHSRCMVTRGLTVETISARFKELVDIKLVQVYGDGKYLHIFNHYTRLRSDGHGSDVRYPKPAGAKSKTTPDSEGAPTGDQKVSLDLDLDSDRDLDIGLAAPVETGTADEGQPATPSKPEPEPRKSKALNAQAQAVKDCVDSYLDGRAKIGQPFPGQPECGCVVRWLGKQPTREGAISTFRLAVDRAVAAHKLSPRWHGFPMTLPKFVNLVPELVADWLDKAKAEARKRPTADPIQPALSGDGLLRRQCVDEHERKRDGCHCDQRFCAGCPGPRKPYSAGPARRTGETSGGGFRAIQDMLPKAGK